MIIIGRFWVITEEIISKRSQHGHGRSHDLTVYYEKFTAFAYAVAASKEVEIM